MVNSRGGVDLPVGISVWMCLWKRAFHRNNNQTECHTRRQLRHGKTAYFKCKGGDATPLKNLPSPNPPRTSAHVNSPRTTHCTGPWTVTRSFLHMLHRVAAFSWPLRPVLLLVLFPCLRSPVVGVLGLCWMWRDLPFACQRRPVVGVLGLCWLLRGSSDCFCCARTSVLRPSTTCLAAFPCA